MTSEERAEAKRMVQEALEESRDRIRAEKAEAALQAANEAWDRAWEKAMPRYKPQEAVTVIAQPKQKAEQEINKERGAWQYLYGICTGALGVLIIACTVILTKML